MKHIENHPILDVPQRERINFFFNGKKYTAFKDIVISSALIMNDINIFGYHFKDNSPQGIFCANGQCAQCMVLVDGIPKKGCMTKIEKGMKIERCEGLPAIPKSEKLGKLKNPLTINPQVLIIGGGPAGLSAANVLAEKGIELIIVDDKMRLGGKLLLQTHKFFGSQEDVYAGKRGIEIAHILGEKVKSHNNVEIWVNSPALAVFSDRKAGILKNGNEYCLVNPEHILICTGAREKMLIFPGDTLPGVFGAGAFQTLVNRDHVKPSEKIFIVGGGNVGLIAGYHALQAGIEVVGLIEAMNKCGGYKVHEDKLRNFGVPIYTNHTIVSANGKSKVQSITIAELDENWNQISNTEKTFECDTILIAVGLISIDEFYHKAQEFGLKSWIAGDAREIAEASSAIYTGKIEGLKILKDMGIKINENLEEIHQKAEMIAQSPPDPIYTEIIEREKGIFPIFHCNQKIPCNPCTTVCPQHQIATKDDLITELPYFKDEKECLGCGECVAVCPGLAITLIDYRKDKENPIVTFAYEMGTSKLEVNDSITVMSNKGELGQYKIDKVRVLKKYPHTQLVSIKLPKNIAKKAIGITKHPDVHHKPLVLYNKPKLPDEAIVCRCERVTAGEIRKWIKMGVTDINELKALTRASLGACGGKTCTPLIEKLYLDEGFSKDDIIEGTVRLINMEVPMKYFAGYEQDKEER